MTSLGFCHFWASVSKNCLKIKHNFWKFIKNDSKWKVRFVRHFRRVFASFSYCFQSTKSSTQVSLSRENSGIAIIFELQFCLTLLAFDLFRKKLTTFVIFRWFLGTNPNRLFQASWIDFSVVGSFLL